MVAGWVADLPCEAVGGKKTPFFCPRRHLTVCVVIVFALTMIGLAGRPDLREECILNQTGMVLNYAKYAPETPPSSSSSPFLKTKGCLLFPHPSEFLRCTRR